MHPDTSQHFWRASCSLFALQEGLPIPHGPTGGPPNSHGPPGRTPDPSQPTGRVSRLLSTPLGPVGEPPDHSWPSMKASQFCRPSKMDSPSHPTHPLERPAIPSLPFQRNSRPFPFLREGLPASPGGPLYPSQPLLPLLEGLGIPFLSGKTPNPFSPPGGTSDLYWPSGTGLSTTPSPPGGPWDPYRTYKRVF